MTHKVHCGTVVLSLLEMEKKASCVCASDAKLDRACLQSFIHTYVVNNLECRTQSSRCSLPAEDPRTYFENQNLCTHWQKREILRVKADEMTTSEVTIAGWILLCLAHLLLIGLLCRCYSYKYTNELHWGIRIAGTCLTLMMNKWKPWLLLLLKKS